MQSEPEGSSLVSWVPPEELFLASLALFECHRLERLAREMPAAPFGCHSLEGLTREATTREVRTETEGSSLASWASFVCDSLEGLTREMPFEMESPFLASWALFEGHNLAGPYLGAIPWPQSRGSNSRDAI